MKKLLLFLVGVVSSVQFSLATTCPGATAIPAFPTMPYTQTLACGATNDITSANATACGSSFYLGGQEAVYVWTPTAGYSGVTIAYNGVSWSGIMLYAGCPTSGGTCIANITSSATSKTLTVPGTLTAGTQYYIVFDTWPTPNSPCPGTFTLNGTPILPPAPPTPTQDPASPTCSAGSTIDLAGSPATGQVWYWQTSATGTSMAVPYAGPYTIFANGTYYANTYDTGTSQWSATSSSITITNFPTSTPPPAAVAAQDPACSTTGTTISVAAAPTGYTYYWQGTVNGGSSMTSNAATPYPVSATGTYYVAAYETATGCWSNTVGTMVTIGTYIPVAPTATTTNYNICSGTASLPIDATPPPGGAPGTATQSFGTNLVSTGTGAATFNVTMPALPAGATITSAQLQFTNVNSINGSWRSEIRVALSGAYSLAPTQISTQSSGGLISPDPFVNLSGFPVAGGAITLSLTESYDDFGVDDATFGEAKLVVSYTQNPVSTLTWFDASTGGTLISTASPLESVGTTVMPNTTSAGTYTFYAGATSGGCASATRLPITVNVTQVLADLTPVNVTCNGGSNGSFTLGTVQCGTAPFLYAVDGGAFGPIPTNLTAGTHSVVMQDAVLGTSAPITVIITQPGIPTGLTVNDVNYFNATVSWTPQGDETQWIIEYGPTGFTPGSGTLDTFTSIPAVIPGLSPSTTYQFYVTADCSGTNGFAGPVSFTTNSGFFTFDNACGPGFIDISGTGTALNLTDDGSTTVTPGFPIAFQGTNATSVTVSNNGWISFGGATLNAWNIDLDDEEGNVYQQTIASGGDTYFVVQWNNRPRFSTVAGQDVTFELLISQNTGEVYYVYNDVVFGGTQSSNDYGLQGTISASGPQGSATVSSYSNTYLMNNSCVHFYNALCPNPTNVATTVYQDDAEITWNAGLYGETEWVAIYGLHGFDPAATPSQAIGIDTLTTTADMTFGGTLTQLTQYDVYIYSECQADNLQSPGLMVTFTTLPWCANPSAITTATDVDSLELAWNWTQTDPIYAVDHFNAQYGMTGFPLYTGTTNALGGTNNADTVHNAAFLAGGVYQVYVQAVCISGDTSSFVGPFTFIMPLSNDSVCGAENLAVNGTVYTFNNNGATVALNEASIAPPATGAQTTTGWTNSTLNNTTWFTFQAPASGSVRINNTAINYNGQAAVYEAGTCGDYATFTLEAANDNAIGGTSVAPNFTICGLTPGATYYLMNDGFNGTTGNYSISILPIVLQAGNANPVSNICSGSNIDLFTTVNGNDTAGVWSSSIAAVNASINGSDFTSAGLAYQVFNFQYRVTDGCAYDSIMTQVHVYAPSSAGQDGTITACRNEPIDLLSGLNGNADLTGTWYNPSNVAIANSQITTSNIPGQFNYDYIAGNGICPNDTANVVVTVQNCNYLGLNEEVFNGVSLFPNPSEGTVFITSDATQPFDYAVTDANGRVIAKAKNAVKAAQTTTIDLNNMETGVYFIRLSNDQAAKVFRVVIQ